MTEKSGLDMLEEILRRLEMLDKRVSVLDQNIKAIANSAKVANLAEKLANTPLENWGRATKPKLEAVVPSEPKNPGPTSEDSKGFANFKFQSSDASKTNVGKVLAEKKRMRPSQVMVRGKMIANSGDQIIPLTNISVKIYDASDKLVKETKTNRAGQWLSQLGPGEYVALFEGELHGKKLVPQNRNFVVPKELPPGQQYFEVI